MSADSLTGSINFADCCINGDGLLSTPAGTQQLPLRLATILRALIVARSAAVATEFLLDTCWGVVGGSPQYLPKAIFQLRQALAGSQSVRIQSVYGYGYRLHLEAPEEDRSGDAAIVKALCEEATLRVHDRRSVALKSAQSIYQKATQLDPGCSPALLGYASATLQLLISGWMPARTTWPAARQAARRAPERPPSLVDRRWEEQNRSVTGRLQPASPAQLARSADAREGAIQTARNREQGSRDYPAANGHKT